MTTETNWIEKIVMKLKFSQKKLQDIDAKVLCNGRKQVELIDSNDNTLHCIVYPSGKKVLYTRIRLKSRKITRRLGEL